MLRVRSYLIPAGACFALMSCLTVLALIYWSFRRMGDLQANAPEFIGLVLLAGVVYVAAVYVNEHYPSGRWGLGIILAGALLFRLLLLPLWPSLSQDLYRYRWQGRVHQAGLNPYTVTPATANLECFRDETFTRIGTQKLSTVYPPLAEKVFAWNLRWTSSIPDYKRLFVFFDLASVAVLLLVLRARAIPGSRVIAYAWNPVVVTSFAASGHYDSLAIFTMLGALLLSIWGRPALSMVFLALSVLSKFFAVLLLPAVLKSATSPATGGKAESSGYSAVWRFAGFGGLFIALIVFVYLPYAEDDLFGGLCHFVRHYENNDSLFRVLRYCGNSHLQAQLVASVFLLLLVVMMLRGREDLLISAFLLTAAIVLLSPNAFPWYFTWSIPFLCFHLNPAWLLMSVTAVIGYAPVIEYGALGIYRNSPYLLWLEYGPVFALGVGQFIYGRVRVGRGLKPGQ